RLDLVARGGRVEGGEVPCGASALSGCFAERAAQVRDIADLRPQDTAPVAQDFGRSLRSRANEPAAGAHRLEKSEAEGLIAGRAHIDVRDAIDRRDIFAVSEQADAAVAGGQALELASPWAGAGDYQADVLRTRCKRPSEGAHQDVHAFLRHQATDREEGDAGA